MYLLAWSWLLAGFIASASAGAIFVDPGVPYANGPLNVGQLVLSKTAQNSPIHSIVFFPLTAGEYPVIFFIGGLNGIVLSEYYELYLNKVAAHGFVVVGVDPDYPVVPTNLKKRQFEADRIDLYYQQINFTRQYLVNRTAGVARWDKLGLLCHSSGCDDSLTMVRQMKFNYTATAFLEPYSNHAKDPVDHVIPAMMYGTQLAGEGIVKCSIKGHDFDQFYSIWKCPRIVLEVAEFGHCDILDPVEWEGCHATHFCKTTNDTRLAEYRQFVQGVTASFFITQLQGRQDAINYIVDQTKSPLKLLEDISDLSC